MNINATLIGQMITFVIFVAFTMKFVWPPIMHALEERKKKIADGLAAAERGVRELEVAKHKSSDLIRDAKIHAAALIDKANKRATQIIDEAKQQARVEGERLLALAQEEIDKELNTAKMRLREQAASMVITGVAKILDREIDAAANSNLIDKLISEI